MNKSFGVVTLIHWKISKILLPLSAEVGCAFEILSSCNRVLKCLCLYYL